MTEKTLQEEVAEPTYEQQREALTLILMMKVDVQTAMTTGVPIVIDTPGAMTALMTVIEVAEKATVAKLTPILGADGKMVKL
jgi:hypothetical protein